MFFLFCLCMYKKSCIFAGLLGKTVFEWRICQEKVNMYR